ncbi:heat-inducible transcription repressor Hrc [Acrasis kona]|uniref:Heat-inducible transcription repressor Hrc n=1 Tax=Acrasis kona TaxID=1008807 RepID=A0AAW2ZDI0_9EUKA
MNNTKAIDGADKKEVDKVRTVFIGKIYRRDDQSEDDYFAMTDNIADFIEDKFKDTYENIKTAGRNHIDAVFKTNADALNFIKEMTNYNAQDKKLIWSDQITAPQFNEYVYELKKPKNRKSKQAKKLASTSTADDEFNAKGKPKGATNATLERLEAMKSDREANLFKLKAEMALIEDKIKVEQEMLIVLKKAIGDAKSIMGQPVRDVRDVKLKQ